MDERVVLLARLRLASMWRRFLAETVDFILIHGIEVGRRLLQHCGSSSLFPLEEFWSSSFSRIT